MGIFDAARAEMSGGRAYRTHIAANELADAGKPEAARQKYGEAMRLYEAAERLGLSRPNILQGYAILLMREGAFDRAGEVMRRVEKLKGLKGEELFHLRLNYALLQWKLGNLDEAIEIMRRAAGQTKNGAVYTNLGMFLVDRAQQTGAFEEARAFLGEAMAYDDEDAATLDNLGQLYMAISRKAADDGDGEAAVRGRVQAREYFEKAHRLKPRQITTLYALATLYHEDGEDDRARALLADAGTLYHSALCPVSRDMMRALVEAVA